MPVASGNEVLRYAQDDMKQLQITRCVREYAM
jgi:hypothetical protein